MAELNVIEPTGDACCGPEAQETCCDPSEKTSCCGEGAATGTCGCPAGGVLKGTRPSPA